MEYYSAMKKDKRMPFAATWTELEILILSEVRQKEKAKYHMIALICRISNMAQMIPSTKQKQITAKESRLVVPRSGVDGHFGFWMQTVILGMDGQWNPTVQYGEF